MTFYRESGDNGFLYYFQLFSCRRYYFFGSPPIPVIGYSCSPAPGGAANSSHVHFPRLEHAATYEDEGQSKQATKKVNCYKWRKEAQVFKGNLISCSFTEGVMFCALLQHVLMVQGFSFFEYPIFENPTCPMHVLCCEREGWTNLKFSLELSRDWKKGGIV